MAMNRVVNDPNRVVEDMLIGWLAAHDDSICTKADNPRVVKRLASPEAGNVGVVTGGGSGHEPAFLGYVGDGLLDAVARLQPGVLGDADSHAQDSFNPALDGLLDCPHYTRPEIWQDQAVPDVLLSGHHVNIERWRRNQRLLLTLRLRPELIDQARRAGHLTQIDEAELSGYNHRLPDPL